MEMNNSYLFTDLSTLVMARVLLVLMMIGQTRILWMIMMIYADQSLSKIKRRDMEQGEK